MTKQLFAHRTIALSGYLVLAITIGASFVFRYCRVSGGKPMRVHDWFGFELQETPIPFRILFGDDWHGIAIEAAWLVLVLAGFAVAGWLITSSERLADRKR